MIGGRGGFSAALLQSALNKMVLAWRGGENSLCETPEKMKHCNEVITNLISEGY